MAERDVLLEKLNEQATFVDGSADRVSRGLASLEAFLQGLPGKFPAKTDIGTGESLAFERFSDEWRLTVQVSTSKSSWSSRAVADLNLEKKMYCAAFAPNLVHEILREYDRRRALAEKALTGIGDALGMLGLEKEGR